MRDGSAGGASFIQTSVLIKVPFQDVDMFSIVWHGNYVRYLELARCQLLDEMGYNYTDMQASGYVFPVVDLKLRYIKPLVFGQKVNVRARLKEWQHWLKIQYLICDAESGVRLSKASTRQVAVELSSMEMLDESPAVLISKVESVLSESR